MSVASADALQDWLARVTGGRVLTWEAVTSGNSRSTFAADVEVGGERLALVVRHDEGGGPVAGTALSLEREAAVYRALEGSGLPVPRLYAATPTLGAMAVERLSGAAHESGAVLRELLVQLAALHNLQVERLAPPGFARTAAAELELWQGIARQKLADPDELVELAFAILRDRFPGEPERYVLCHGDFGEGNFLVDGGRVSALLDWEFAHIGDPHDDLAWLTVRALMFGHDLTGFDAAVRADYAPAALVALSPARLRYWQAVTVLRNLVCCLAVASAPPGRDRSVHLMLLPGLRHRLVRLLAELGEVELPRVAPLPDERPLAEGAECPGDGLVRELASGLGDLAAAVSDPGARRRARRLQRIAEQFAENWWRAPAVGVANAAERERAGHDRPARLRMLALITDRELALLPRSSPIAAGALAVLEDGDVT